MNHLLRPRQSAQVTVDDDSVEAVVYKEQQLTKKLHEQFHGNSIVTGLDNDVNRKKIKRGPGKQGIKGKHFLLAKEIKYIQDRAAKNTTDALSP